MTRQGRLRPIEMVERRWCINHFALLESQKIASCIILEESAEAIWAECLASNNLPFGARNKGALCFIRAYYIYKLHNTSRIVSDRLMGLGMSQRPLSMRAPCNLPWRHSRAMLTGFSPNSLAASCAVAKPW